MKILHKRTGAVLLEVEGDSLQGADLYGANLIGANLEGANLIGANLRDANLIGANLYDANLAGADLRGADLQGANLRDANLEYADLYGADLTGANLRYADLESADLRGANLWNTIGNGKEIKTAHFDRWVVNYTKTVLQIGCEQHLITEWEQFSDERIARMDSRALGWWKKYKEVIFSIIALSAYE